MQDIPEPFYRASLRRSRRERRGLFCRLFMYAQRLQPPHPAILPVVHDRNREKHLLALQNEIGVNAYATAFRSFSIRSLASLA